MYVRFFFQALIRSRFLECIYWNYPYYQHPAYEGTQNSQGMMYWCNYGYFPTVLYTPLNLLPMVLSVYGGKSWVFHIPSNPAVDFQWTKAWGYLLSDWAYDGSRRGTISTTGRSRKTWVEPIFSLFGGVKADFFLKWHSSFLLCFLVGQGYTVTLFLMGGVDTV